MVSAHRLGEGEVKFTGTGGGFIFFGEGFVSFRLGWLRKRGRGRGSGTHAWCGGLRRGSGVWREDSGSEVVQPSCGFPVWLSLLFPALLKA